MNNTYIGLVLFLGLGLVSCSSAGAISTPEAIATLPTTTRVTSLPTEILPTVTPTEVPVLPGTVVIEGVGEVAPLDIKLTTEWTADYKKIPKVTEADIASGALRETVLEAWKEQGKLTKEALAGIYVAKAADWGVSPTTDGPTQLEVLNWSVPEGHNGPTMPIQRTPETFNLVDKDGKTIGLVAASEVIFERPDKTIGIDVWFYRVEDAYIKDAYKIEALTTCFGYNKADLQYPLPYITPSIKQFYDWANPNEWVARGDQARQQKLLLKILTDGYPKPDLGKETLMLMCNGIAPGQVSPDLIQKLDAQRAQTTADTIKVLESPKAIPGTLVIEGMGEVAPLDIKLNTEWTGNYENMPTVTEADFVSGAMRETVLEAWKAQGKLTKEALAGIYAAKAADWIDAATPPDGPDLLNAINWDVPEGHDAATMPFQRTPETFRLVDKDGKTIGLVATSEIVFERPDKTIGIEPWFYRVEDSYIKTPADLASAMTCFGYGETLRQYPAPDLTAGTTTIYDLASSKDWVARGDQARQQKLLMQVIADGYPKPDLGKELLMSICNNN
jgi:hypothetical protein